MHIKNMMILSEIYEKMVQSCSVPPETGGIIGEKNGIVCSCFFDNCLPQNSRAVYIPNVGLLNKVINEWSKSNIQFCGIFHSHPVNQPNLSADDLKYINIIFDRMPGFVNYLFFPIVIPKVKLIVFKAMRQKNKLNIYKDKITIIKEFLK